MQTEKYEEIKSLNTTKREYPIPCRLTIPWTTAKLMEELVEKINNHVQIDTITSPTKWVFEYSGQIEDFVIPPYIRKLQIEAFGAQGGTYPRTVNYGGRGAYASGVINVIREETLKILVGQKGLDGFSAGGGGGGSFVVRQHEDDFLEPLVVAGGGGGAGFYSSGGSGKDTARNTEGLCCNGFARSRFSRGLCKSHPCDFVPPDQRFS